ncbi:MAG: arylsulfotransferase family protein [Candidatus Hydrogenedentota bacterium]
MPMYVNRKTPRSRPTSGRGPAVLGSVALLGAFCAGYFVHRNELLPLAWRDGIRGAISGPSDSGGPERANTSVNRGEALPIQTDGVSPELPERNAEAILALGYVQAERARPGGRSGVVAHDPNRAHEGVNLYISGNAPEAVLMDMDGRELHRWHCNFDAAFPNTTLLPHISAAIRNYFRRVHLYPTGELLAVFEGVGLIKLDWDSNLIWTYAGGCHHDLSIADSGEIYVLTNELRRFPELNPEHDVVDNSIAVLSAEGKELRRASILDCIANSDYRALLGHIPKNFDVLHTNTIKHIAGAPPDFGPAFRDGNVLISLLTIDTVAMVDLELNTVVWAITGLFDEQHEPTLMPNGNILVFDNHAGPGTSRVVEISPMSKAVVWSYPGPDDQPFYSDRCSTAARLPNGNTLITISGEGRAVEVTHTGEIVWEFVNPNQFVENGVAMISMLFDVCRLPEDYCAAGTTSERAQ